MKRILVGFCLLLSGTLAGQTPFEKSIKNMPWRPIGPANMGGRVTDIAGIPGDPATFYVAGADGGLFKTTNGGTTFTALFTDQKAYSVGAIAIAPSDKEVVWLGSGEGDPRNSIGYGNGVYRSLDGGKSWTHLGLDKTDRIKRIVVNPQNPDVACVCALGRTWGPNSDRGVFQTKDGGKTWKKVLYIDDNTGCSDLAIEWSNPRVMYAGMWTHRRKPWRFDDSGEKTALYKSMDGGDTWTKISHQNGLPNKPMARIGVAVAQSQPNTVYLITEFKDGGTLFRSDDRGGSWRMVNDNRQLNFRPFYYADLRVDPNNPDHVYTLSGGLSKSTDGGKTFAGISQGVHADHQALWIDPTDSRFVLSGCDGGYQISWDAGRTWEIINNIELSQYYQVFVDNQEPYNVYGGLQDNGTWVGPSNSLLTAGIMKRHWKALAGGDGYYAVPIPGSEHEIYANLQGGVPFHVDTRTGNVRNIHPYPNKTGSAGDAIDKHRYRFNWDSPIHVSPHDGNTVYLGSNVIFRSRDKGYSWEEISPDLTTNDKSKQGSSGGEIYQDNTAAEFHCTVLTIAESPVQKDVIWAGTDDGNIQVTRDGGKTWANVKGAIAGLPAFSWVSKIHASEHDAGTAFVAVDQHRLDDYNAYAFMTTDFGKTWTKISTGLPADWVYVVRQDPHNANLLYAGMEHGIFASADKGKTWNRINNNMPPVSVRDIRIQKRDRDLVAATHGRGIWIMDDMRWLEELDANVSAKELHGFAVKPATLWKMYDQLENLGHETYRAANPAYGAWFTYYLKGDLKERTRVEVTVLDADGKTVRTLRDSTAKAGVNRIVWNLRYTPATAMAGGFGGGGGGGGGGGFGGGGGPLAAPGEYKVRIAANGQTVEMPFTVRKDPRIPASVEDLKLKHATAVAVRDMLSETNKMINESDAVMKQLDEVSRKLKTTGDKVASDLVNEATRKLKEFRDEVLRRPPPTMNYRTRPRLREEVQSLMGTVDGAEARPTVQQLARVKELDREVSEAKAAYQKILDTDISQINEKVKDLPQIVVSKPVKTDM